MEPTIKAEMGNDGPAVGTKVGAVWWVKQGRVAVDSRAARSLRNSAMHLRKACNHPYLFLAGQQPPYEPADPEELVRASGKLHLMDNILPKLRATGASTPL